MRQTGRAWKRRKTNDRRNSSNTPKMKGRTSRRVTMQTEFMKFRLRGVRKLKLENTLHQERLVRRVFDSYFKFNSAI